MSDEKLFVNPKTGLVACKVNTSSAAAGVRKGETRGFPLEVAEKLIASKHVTAVPKADVVKAVKKQNTKAKAKEESKAEETPATGETPPPAA